MPTPHGQPRCVVGSICTRGTEESFVLLFCLYISMYLLRRRGTSAFACSPAGTIAEEGPKLTLGLSFVKVFVSTPRPHSRTHNEAVFDWPLVWTQHGQHDSSVLVCPLFCSVRAKLAQEGGWFFARRARVHNGTPSTCTR